MKIEINLMDNGISHLNQMEAVNKYIKENTIKKEDINYLGMPVSGKHDLTLFSNLTLKETTKDTGHKIETEQRNFHVSCKKTKRGAYKFNVWQAV